MIKHAVVPVIASTLLLASAPANADEAGMSNETAYLYAFGQKQGQIKGGVTQKGRESSIKVVDVRHSIVSPRDPQSGLPTGQRMHKPFVVTKEIDKASPLLETALVTNENLTSVTLKFWTPQLQAASGVGAEVQHYTIKLTNANIASIEVKPQMINGKEELVEQISFTYQKIEWTWNDGGITASDDWKARM
jgi:type VI secretion system secreted protein Hcp